MREVRGGWRVFMGVICCPTGRWPFPLLFEVEERAPRSLLLPDFPPLFLGELPVIAINSEHITGGFRGWHWQHCLTSVLGRSDLRLSAPAGGNGASSSPSGRNADRPGDGVWWGARAAQGSPRSFLRCSSCRPSPTCPTGLCASPTSCYASRTISSIS